MCLVCDLALQRCPRGIVAAKIQKGKGLLGGVHHRKCANLCCETYTSVTAFNTPCKIASLTMELHEPEIEFLQPEQIMPRLNPLEKFLSLLL